jgi:UDP-N-acetylmuramoyl-L-alanyl-D-glutamate--2,6-diaminopimelate ligase
MGAIAGRLCDLVVVTDVNPFDDDPKEIIEMLAKGAREAGKKDGVDLFLEVDRRAGIKKAFALAGPGDVVAITAKGTEPCIVVAGGKRLPWDDRTVAREELRALR